MMIVTGVLGFIGKNLVKKINSSTKQEVIIVDKPEKKILKNNTYLKNLRQTSGKDFVIDLFCIAKSKLVISTVGAGVVQSAYYLGNQKLKIIILNNTFNIMFMFIFRLLVLIIFYLKRFKSFFFEINSHHQKVYF